MSDLFSIDEIVNLNGSDDFKLNGPLVSGASKTQKNPAMLPSLFGGAKTKKNKATTDNEPDTKQTDTSDLQEIETSNTTSIDTNNNDNNIKSVALETNNNNNSNTTENNTSIVSEEEKAIIKLNNNDNDEDTANDNDEDTSNDNDEDTANDNNEDTDKDEDEDTDKDEDTTSNEIKLNNIINNNKPKTKKPSIDNVMINMKLLKQHFYSEYIKMYSDVSNDNTNLNIEENTDTDELKSLLPLFDDTKLRLVVLAKMRDEGLIIV